MKTQCHQVVANHLGTLARKLHGIVAALRVVGTSINHYSRKRHIAQRSSNAQQLLASTAIQVAASRIEENGMVLTHLGVIHTRSLIEVFLSLLILLIGNLHLRHRSLLPLISLLILIGTNGSTGHATHSHAQMRTNVGTIVTSYYRTQPRSEHCAAHRTGHIALVGVAHIVARCRHKSRSHEQCRDRFPVSQHNQKKII